jgi:hypothetical protein
MDYQGLQYFITRDGKEIPFEDMPEAFQNTINDVVRKVHELVEQVPCIDHGATLSEVWLIDNESDRTFRVQCCCWARGRLVETVSRQLSLPLAVSFPPSSAPIPSIQLQRLGELETHLYRCLSGKAASDSDGPNPNNTWPHPN